MCSACCQSRWRSSVGRPPSSCRDIAASRPVGSSSGFQSPSAFTREVGFYETPLADGATAVFVDCPELFDREACGVGGADYSDSPRRFALLVRGPGVFGAAKGRPSVVHAHDWQAGLAPVYLRTLRRIR
jgi:glycogen synthase